MNFIQSVKTCFKKYGTFSGRATRSEYWYWVLFFAISNVLTCLLDIMIFPLPTEGSKAFYFPINTIFVLLFSIPSIAVGIRRLHDVNRSGWWLLIGLTIIGLIYPLLVWKCTKGTQEENRFDSQVDRLDFVQSVKTAFKKCTTFSGRATRSEYWFWILFCYIFYLLMQSLDMIIFPSRDFFPISTISLLIIFLFSIPIFARRMHDVNHSGWWWFIGLTIIGLIYPLFVWKCTKGTQGENRFGSQAE